MNLIRRERGKGQIEEEWQKEKVTEKEGRGQPNSSLERYCRERKQRTTDKLEGRRRKGVVQEKKELKGERCRLITGGNLKFLKLKKK